MRTKFARSGKYRDYYGNESEVFFSMDPDLSVVFFSKQFDCKRR